MREQSGGRANTLPTKRLAHVTPLRARGSQLVVCPHLLPEQMAPPRTLMAPSSHTVADTLDAPEPALSRFYRRL
jgi:hypothetical protein